MAIIRSRTGARVWTITLRRAMVAVQLYINILYCISQSDPDSVRMRRVVATRGLVTKRITLLWYNVLRSKAYIISHLCGISPRNHGRELDRRGGRGLEISPISRSTSVYLVYSTVWGLLRVRDVIECQLVNRSGSEKFIYNVMK